MTAVIAARQTFDMKFEVAVIPVSDIDRSKRFYEDDLGWRLDADFVRSDGSRAVQLTPPGSPSSIQLGSGPAARFYLVVNDIEAARAEFVARGVNVSEIFHRGIGKASAARILTGAVMLRSSGSTIRTVTTGWYRRLPNACPDA